MNDRIRELVRQAGLDDADFPIEDWDNVPLARYTELIVQECIQVCLSQRDPANLNYKPSERFAEAVKQHFGVEP